MSRVRSPIFALMLCLLLAACGDETVSSGGDRDVSQIRPEPDGSMGGSDMGPTDASTDDLGVVDAGGDADSGADVPPPECFNDDDCDDGTFCNGFEICFEGECFDSPAFNCADHTPCTVDSCNEEEDYCERTPDDSRCAPGQVCDPKAGCFTPSQCSSDVECDDGLFCNGAETCDEGACKPGTPPDCADGISCTEDSCDEESDVCQNVADHTACLGAELCSLIDGCVPRPPCTRDDDCDDGLFCNGTETCDDGTCAPGTPPDTTDTVDCTIDQCAEQLDMVVHIPDSARCSDGEFCNGPEVCHPTNGCGPGTPPVLSDGVPCTDDTCNEDLDFIEHTPDDGYCDDGAYCNGAEVCHPQNGCGPGQAPNKNDGVGCTIDTCDEVNDEIVHQPDDSQCSDSLFCNGEEICDPVDDCQAGTPPTVDDGVPCTDDSCDETNDVIVNAPDDAYCDNGQFCDGEEVCDSSQGCIATNVPVIDDGVPCTDDSCDEANDVVVNAPDDTDCDNGQYCDGSETCDTSSGCVDGPDPDVDDGNPCTVDACDEANDTDTHTDEPDGTVCGSSPRKICLTGTCVESTCGDMYVDTDAGEECDDGNMVSGDGCSNCMLETTTCDPDDIYTIIAGTSPSYTCCGGIVDVDVSQFSFSNDGARITTSPNNPVDMTGAGATCPDGSFQADGSIFGGCTETYEVTGTFTDANTWDGTYSVTFTGSDCDCFGGALGSPCVDQTWDITAQR